MSRAGFFCLPVALACAALVLGQVPARDEPASGAKAESPAPAESASEGFVREGFEGPRVRLGLLECDGPHRVESHQCAPGAHSGYQCEQLQLQLGQGTKCYVGLAVKPARVIDELTASIWLKCDRPGPQLLARVVLPNTTDPRSGGPATILVQGDTYKDPGRWQALGLRGIPDQLVRATRGLQGQFGAEAFIDAREAYLDYLLLNVHVGAGRVSVSVDDLELASVVATDADPGVSPSERPAAGEPGRSDAAPPRGAIRCQGSQLVVGDRPIFVRAVQHQGEPLEFLKGLGFNAVQFDEPPSAQLLGEAARAGLWVIGPPPDLGAAPVSGPFGPISRQWDAVLAWDLGRGLSTAQFDWFCQQARLLRQTDRGPQRQSRPILCDPLTDCRAFSRHADILRPSRRPLGSTLELADYGVWLRERPRLTRPGMALWTTIQTQPAPEYVAQAQALVPGTTPPAGVSLEQLRLLACLGVASGSRGLLFESRGRLDAQDVETRRRAMSLELVNLELGLIEPWAAAGSLAATLSSAEMTPSSQPVVAGLLQTEKARLLLPMWLARGAQFVTGQSAATNLAFVVPGVPPAHDGYELTPTSLQRLDQRRVARGVRVTVPDFGVAAMVVFTADPVVLRSLNERIARVSARAARLQQDLAQMKLMRIEQLQQQMVALQATHAHGPQYVALARSLVQQSEAALRAGQFEKAYRGAEAGMRPLRLLERAYWDKAVEEHSPAALPLAADSGTLPQHVWLAQRLRGAMWSANALPAGDCEDVEKMRSAGWRLSQHPAPGVKVIGEVAPGNARAGHLSVRMAAQAADPRSPPDLLESPSVWLTTPPVEVPLGSVVRIHGWVRVPAPITGSVDGVMIFDSLAGPALAVRLDAPPAADQARPAASAWQEFTLYRAVRPQASSDGRVGSVVVTFVLTGLGEVWVDDVTVECAKGG
jgi:hypothetical protein